MRIPKIISLISLLAASAGAQASLVYDFDSNAQGWMGAGGVPAFSWQSSGGVGNSGYIRTVDVAGGQMVAISPSLGNQSALYGGLLSFDYNVFALQLGNVYTPNNQFGTVRISSGSRFVTADLISNIPFASNIAGTGWHDASLALNESNWTGNASLLSVLADVTQISLLTEYDRTQRWPDEIVGVDNVALTSSAVPEPKTAGLLLLGLAGLYATNRKKRRYP